MNIEQLETILKQEVAWHENNLGRSQKGADWEQGFIDGLKAVQALIDRMQTAEAREIPAQ